MDQTIFLQDYFKIIQYLYQIKKQHIKYFSRTTRIDQQKYNEMSEENIKNVTKSDGNFAPTFGDHHV